MLNRNMKRYRLPQIIVDRQFVFVVFNSIFKYPLNLFQSLTILWFIIFSEIINF